MEREERAGTALRAAPPETAPVLWDPRALDALPIGVGHWDTDARLEHANPVLCDLLGTPLSRLVHTDLLDLVSAEDRSTTAVAVVDLLESRRNATQFRLRGAGLHSGEATVPWPLRMYLTTRFGPEGRPAGLLGQVFDFAPAETGPPLPQGLAQVLEEGSDFLLVIEANGLVSYGNRAAREALGVGVGRVHTRLTDLFDPDSLEFFQNVIEPSLVSMGVWQGEVSFRNRELVPVPVSARFVAHGVRSDSDEPVDLGTVSVFARDITELKNAERRLRQLATHDYLTGLPNRLLLYDRLELALNRYTRYGSPVALMFCDLDGFKAVNDVHGHQVGDAVLVEVADRIHSVVRDTDTAARVGGDEFALLIEGVEDIDLLRSVAERLVARLAEPIFVGRVIAEIGVSIGLVVASTRCHQVDSLVALADSAMYQAKAGGRGRYVVITGDDL